MRPDEPVRPSPADAGGAPRDSDEVVLATYVDTTRSAGERQAAFEVLLRRFQRRVFAVCLQVLGSPEDAEDATQETFVRLARSADGFRGDAKLSTWLYRVARNVCTDHVRRDARRPSTPVADVDRVIDRPDTADAQLGVEVGDELRRALHQLEPGARRLLLLVTVEGLSYEDAAALADLPVGTVKSRVSRARVRLGELLATSDAAADEPPPADAPTSAPPSRSSAPRGPPTHPT